MSRSRLWSSLTGSALVVVLAGMSGGVAQAQRPAEAAKPAPADDKVAHGRYIVEEVAMCGRCHSPVDMHGNRDTTHWLLGGAVGISPTVATDNWAIVAPRLGGGPPGTDEQFVQLMMTGISRTGRRLRQPMPQFRMSKDDAESVLAYLKAIGGNHVLTQ